MIKELFLALALGALLGFGITGTYIAVKKNQSPPPIISSITPTTIPADTTITVTPIIAITNNATHLLTIDSPENESVATSSQMTIKGTTTPLSSIVITTVTENFYTTADTSGKFSYDITLDSGINLIQIDSIDSDDNIVTSQILVTYSTAKF